MAPDRSIASDAKQVCAIVVSYNPAPDLASNIEALAGQVGQIVIVDNGSQAEGAAIVRNVLASHRNVFVVANQTNMGIATALNFGVRWAIDNGFRWVATFDQDSHVPAGFIDALLDTAQAFPAPRELALVAPVYYDPERQSNISVTSRTNRGVVLTTATSGNLVPVETFRQVGLFRDELFIDHVDSEFCLRCVSRGMRIIECPDTTLTHHLGRPTVHRVLGKSVWMSNYSAERRYYQVRNRVWIFRRYFLRFPAWTLKDVVAFTIYCTGAVMFQSDRPRKIRAIVRGLYDGLRGHYGPLNT